MKTVSDPGGEIEFVATEDSITASFFENDRSFAGWRDGKAC